MFQPRIYKRHLWLYIVHEFIIKKKQFLTREKLLDIYNSYLIRILHSLQNDYRYSNAYNKI